MPLELDGALDPDPEPDPFVPMFGQLPLCEPFGAAPFDAPLGSVVDGVEDDGAGLAAITTETPPIVRRPMVSAAVATIRRRPVAFTGAGDGLEPSGAGAGSGSQLPAWTAGCASGCEAEPGVGSGEDAGMLWSSGSAGCQLRSIVDSFALIGAGMERRRWLEPSTRDIGVS